MTALPDLVRDELHDLADSHPVPADLTDRAIGAGLRRRRRTATAVAASLAVVTLPVAIAAVHLGGATGGPDVDAGADRARNVVYAVHRGAWDGVKNGPYQVLDPATGAYRDVPVGELSQPSADLRYAMVLPPWVYEPDKMPDSPTRVGRYESTTGQIRWYETGESVTDPQISPDGRRAVFIARARTPGAPARWVWLDLDTGAVTTIHLDAQTERAIEESTAPGTRDVAYRTRPVRWHPDSRHLVVVGHIVVDLRGRVTRTLPVPDGAAVTTVRPSGDGLLVRPLGSRGGYALSDGRGRIVAQADLHPACQPFPPSGWTGQPQTRGQVETPDGTGTPPDGRQRWSCTPGYSFLSWRGDASILVDTGDHFGSRIEALDLRTGDLRPVHSVPQSPRVDQLFVMPATGLPAHVPTF